MREDTVAEVMARHPVTISIDSPVSEAAREMAQADVGAVVVLDDNGRVVGICTDRDITVRVTAAKRGPETTVQEACTDRYLTAIAPDTLLTTAAAVMRANAVRRLPVLDADRLVGVISLGDLAMDRDPDSTLAEISAADPNR